MMKLSAMTPLPHQEQLADKLQDPNVSGQVAYHGIGSGKTFTSIHAADKLHLPILAIVPAPLRNNYRKELRASGFNQPARVMSYDEALKKKDDPELQQFASKSLVTYDEAHRMGQSESQRSQLPKSLHGKKTLLLTATPLRNSPEELAPLVNAVEPGSLPEKPEEFKQKFLHTREVPVGFWGRLKGIDPGTEKVPVNLDKFRAAVKNKVDFYQSADRKDFPSFEEKIFEVPMSDRQQASYDFVMGRYPTLSYRIRHGLPLNRNEESNFQSFMIGPRQVSNHPGSFNVKATDEDAPKIQAMADEIQKRHAKDKHFRGVSYSAFLESGIDPLARALDRRGIHYAKFTGEVSDTQRKKIVENYNAGKVPVLLVSGAGAEGLDLKGTKLMQIMEPHWQEELIDQVRGRAIRYKSHSHLPENERHVEVQRFHTIPQLRLWDRLLGRSRSGERSADEYLFEMAKRKRAINQEFLKQLQNGAPPQEKVSFVEYTPVDDERYPGILVDVDDTIVSTPGAPCPSNTGQQRPLPGRIEILKKFKDAGYRIVGVTNRNSVHFPDVQTLQAVNRETLDLFGGILDDVIYIAVGPSVHSKPAPTMLQYAMQKYRMDIANTIMIGDSEADHAAAACAKIPFVHSADFFGDQGRFNDIPKAEPVPFKAAEWTDWANMNEHVRKHSYEFGSPEAYVELEKHMAVNPPHDLVPVNRRSETLYGPHGEEVTRSATAYHSLSVGVMHVKDDETGKTVSLYRKLKPKNFPKLLIGRR